MRRVKNLPWLQPGEYVRAIGQMVEKVLENGSEAAKKYHKDFARLNFPKYEQQSI